MSICGVVATCDVADESGGSIRGIKASRDVVLESKGSICGVVDSCGVGGESIESIRGIAISCGVGEESTRSIRGVGINIPSSSSYYHSIDRGIYSRHEIATRTRETHPFDIVASEYEIDIIGCSEEVGSWICSPISRESPSSWSSERSPSCTITIIDIRTIISYSTGFPGIAESGITSDLHSSAYF